MLEYLLCINGEYVIHRIFSGIGDGACVFRSLSFVMHGTNMISREVRELIVSHVEENWARFAIMTHDRKVDYYYTTADYYSETGIHTTYGSSCEFAAVGKLLNFIFDVYLNGYLCYSLVLLVT